MRKPHRMKVWRSRAATVPNAYVAVITLESDGFLLGGTRRHESSPFAEERDAIAFAEQCRQVNQDRPGYADAKIDVRIVPVFAKNPIPAVS